MILEVDPADPTPVYEQIRGQVAVMVAAGTLTAGTRLPTIRQLALDLGVAKGTVAKAYESLLRDGVVASEGRRGTIVSSRAPRSGADVGEELRQAARSYAVRARQLGVDDVEVVREIRRALTELEGFDTDDAGVRGGAAR